MKLPDYPDPSSPMSKSWLCQWLREAVDYHRATTVTKCVGMNATVSYAGTSLTIDESIRRGGASTGRGVLYGTAAADYSSGTTISLTPCDANSIDTGEDDLDVSIPDDWGTVNLLSATVGGVDDVTVTCKIASGTLLQYAFAGATPYLLGLPPTVVEFLRYDNSTYKLQQRVRWLFGTNVSTLSDWIDFATSEESLKTPCTTPGS